MNLTYRNAWSWIDAMNRLAPSPLVLKITGGVGGGRAWLTDEGHSAIATYHQMRARLGELLKPDISYSTNDKGEVECIQTEPEPVKVNNLTLP
jgi:molybdate transport repressor ModE-like protein